MQSPAVNRPAVLNMFIRQKSARKNLFKNLFVPAARLSLGMHRIERLHKGNERNDTYWSVLFYFLCS